MQQYNVIAMTTVRQRQQQEQLRKTTIQTTIQHVAHLPVVDVDDATAATIATCVHLDSGLATFLIPRGGRGGCYQTTSPPLAITNSSLVFGLLAPKKNHCVDWSTIRRVAEDRRQKKTSNRIRVEKRHSPIAHSGVRRRRLLEQRLRQSAYHHHHRHP